jgi:selenocysteine lyase/cysteine desulfurase
MPEPDAQLSSPARAFADWESRGRGYLNAAAYGLPPRSAITATRHWVDDWSAGAATFQEWLPATESARESFARLTGLDVSEVATGSSVSQLVGLVAASVPAGTTVLAAEDEFGSLLFPFLVQADRGVRVELVRREQLADISAERGDVVIFSLVESATGDLADWRAIVAAVGARGGLTLVDTAQACGWLAIDYSHFDAVVCPAFKWLCGPRGTAFLRVAPALLDQVRPSGAGWWSSQTGAHLEAGRLALASDARRLDISPVWTSWAGTAAALATIEGIGGPAIADHALGLASRLRAGLWQAPGATPIVVAAGDDSFDRLASAGIVASRTRAGARLALHAWNDVDDVDRALDALVR